MSLSIEQIVAAIKELDIEDRPLTRTKTIQLLTNMTDTLRAVKDSPAFLELTEHEEFDSDSSIGDVIQALDEILDGAERVNNIIQRPSLGEFESGQDFYQWGEDYPEGASAEFLRDWNSAQLQASN